MFDWLLSLDRRRKRLLAKAPPGPLADFLAVPFPPREADCRVVEFLAMDMETTGLDARRDQILSIGSVPVRRLCIPLAECHHVLVRADGDIPAESAVVHHIFDDRSRDGRTLESVIPEVLAALAGRVLIAHFARIEVEFLASACRRLYGLAPVLPVVDTMQIEHRRHATPAGDIQPGTLRLNAARERYGLPRYPAHDALTDAIAAAELFLAQVAHKSGDGAARLRDYQA